MQLKNLFSYFLAAGFALALAAPVQAALRIEITEGVTGALPIAIVPFGGAELPVDIAGVVESDLNGTGLFQALPRSEMLAQPHTIDQVNFRNWSAVEVDNLVIGRVQPSDQGYLIQFDILDVYQGRSVARFNVSSSPSNLRYAAHTVADLIYQEFTGNKGYFTSRIAYVTGQRVGEQGQFNLIVADYDGYGPKTILTTSNPLLSPAWSPSGDQLAYVTFDIDRGRSILWLHDLRNGNRREISSRPGINGAPAFSPDGSRLAMTLSNENNPDIYVYNIGSGDFQRLTNSSAIDTEPTWSPDGRHLAFTSDRGGKPQVYRIPASGGEAKRMTFEGDSNQRPAWSPTGDHLATVQGGNGYRIAVFDLKSNNMAVVSDGPLDESPSFAPNGQVLIYARKGGGSAELATVSLDGKIKQRLSQSGTVREPAWSLPSN